MRLRISKSNKNNVTPVNEERLPQHDSSALTGVEKEIIESLYRDYKKFYSQFEWYPEADLVDVLKGILDDGGFSATNTLVLGRPGWGKTYSVSSLADALGLEHHTISLSTSQREDIAGIPIVKNVNNSMNQNDLFSGHEEWGTFSTAEKRELEKKILSSFSYTDQSPPKWMIRTFIAGAIYGKKTIWFFDEINLAEQGVIDGAFEIIHEKQIPGTNISLDPYVFLIAAGNFTSDNPSVKILSDPAMGRFPNKIAIAENWESGVKGALSAWKAFAKKRGTILDADTVTIVDKIVLDPEFKRILESTNNALATARRNKKDTEWTTDLNPRYLTQKVITGIYKAARAYLADTVKNPATIITTFNGTGAIRGYSVPDALLQYFVKKIQDINASENKGTDAGQEIGKVAEAVDMASKWIENGVIPKDKDQSSKRLQRVLGLSTEEIEVDLKAIIEALKTTKEFEGVKAEIWEATANVLRPKLELSAKNSGDRTSLDVQ